MQMLDAGNKKIASFDIGQANLDAKTVASFGEEWGKFASFTDEEITNAGNQYFDIVDGRHINAASRVLDVGCGTGRWSKYISSKVQWVEAIDPSDAVFSAAKLLSSTPNVRITKASADNIPFPDNSFDLVFSLGVLHHIPDTQLAMQHCVSKVKPGGFFLVYLYYALDNRTVLYKFLFWMSNLLRMLISNFPSALKKFICDAMAVLVYLPLVLLSRLFLTIGAKGLAHAVPLSYYADKSFNIIRNDSLDRFGTPLEQRFTKDEIVTMMKNSGLSEINFSNGAPYWHAIGRKA